MTFSELKKATKSFPQRFALATLLVGLGTAFVACSGVDRKSSSNGGDGGGGGGGGGDAGTPTDEEICKDTCSKMILECGIAYDSTCTAGCIAAPAFLECIKKTSDDCDALAQCAYVQDCGALAPSGAGTCKDAQNCQGFQCVGNPDPNCSCNCVSSMSPAKANDLLRIDQCSLTKCNLPCGTMGSQGECVACINSQCGAESANCQTN